MIQFLKENNLLTYDLGPGAEAFSTERDAALPHPVIQGHQVHGSRVAVVDRPGMTREELEGYDAFVTNLPRDEPPRGRHRCADRRLRARAAP